MKLGDDDLVAWLVGLTPADRLRLFAALGLQGPEPALPDSTGERLSAAAQMLAALPRKRPN